MYTMHRMTSSAGGTLCHGPHAAIAYPGARPIPIRVNHHLSHRLPSRACSIAKGAAGLGLADEAPWDTGALGAEIHNLF